MSRRNKSFGYSKKYANAMRSFDRGANRLAKSLSHTSVRRKRSYQSQNKTMVTFEDSSSSWENASLTKKQLTVSCVVGAIFPAMSLAGMDKTEGMTGTVLLVLFFFFAIPFFVMVLIFMIFNTITRPKTKRNAEQNYEMEECTDDATKQRYSPDTEWMGQIGLVDSRSNAELLAPQLLKQVQESDKIIQTTTEPSTFFTRYDFCVGRLLELEECEKYGVAEGRASDLKKYRNLDFRDEAVKKLIHRAEEKYKTKIQSLKTQKARNNWATKFHDSFSEFTPYMSDEQLSALGESSARLLELADEDPLEE